MKYWVNYLKTVGVFIFIFIFLVHCKKMDGNYKQFIEDGQQPYIGKADSVIVKGGNGRIELSWIYFDPKAESYKIYWDNKKDSVVGTLQNSGSIDTAKVMLTDLSEGIHYFEIVLFGVHGNSSISVEAIGSVYGEKYQQSLLTRTYEKISWVGPHAIAINWNASNNEDMVGVNIKYKNRNGKDVKLFFPDVLSSDTVWNLPHPNDTGKFKFQTLFLPDSLALDTFYTAFKSVEAPLKGVELDKSLWSLEKLDNDAWEYPSNRDPASLWDGSVHTSTFINDRAPFPQWLTIDLGQKAILTSFRKNDYWKGDTYRYLYGRGVPRIWEVWASNDPSQDGDWSHWTKLAHFESPLPLSTYGDNNDEGMTENIEAGKEGETVKFSNLDTAYRYIRYKTIQVWYSRDLTWYDPTDYYIRVGELTVYGIPIAE